MYSINVEVNALGLLMPALFSTPVSLLPVIKNAAESNRVAADSRMDRMTIWMRNVESTCFLSSSFTLFPWLKLYQ